MSHPTNVTLLRGAMRNWSDLEHSPAGSGAAARRVVRDSLRGARRVAVVGAHASDLVTGLADEVPELTVIVRSMPDALTLGELLEDTDGARILCGDLLELDVPGDTDSFDLVVALDDVTRMTGPETDPARWEEVFARLVSLVAADGRLLFVAENELGLHRMTSLRSRYTANTDDAWSVTDTFDATRPRSHAAFEDVFGGHGLTPQAVGVTLPTWEEQTVWATGLAEFGPSGPAVLAAACLASPAFRRVGSDPTRLTRAAALGGRLESVASGWWSLASREPARPQVKPTVLIGTCDGDVAVFHSDDNTVWRGETPIAVTAGALPFGETMLDAAADGDLLALRRLVQQLSEHVRGHAEDGRVAADFADARPDNLLGTDDVLTPLLPAAAAAEEDEVFARAIADLVRVIRARGSRHPWPSATDDETMLASLFAMAGRAAPDDLDGLLSAPRRVGAPLPAADVAGLVAVIDRLTETNRALASRATWLENRLRTTERDMQVRAERYRTQLAVADQQREVLRSSAEDLRRSITYRIGNAIIGPVRTLRNSTRED